MWSRIQLSQQGDVGRRVRRYDDGVGAIDEISALLRKHEDAIVNISHDDPPELVQLISGDFSVAGEKLRALSVLVLAGEARRLGDARNDVRSSARLTWLFSMAALVLSLLLIGIMLIETRRYRRMAVESPELARKAEAASRAKSQFLTMMSHELRTPMNGVLGLLALVRQTALNERQGRLIEQAERSGRQMSALLGDILDFSDLQSESLVMARDMFEISGLAEAVEEMFGPIVQREGVTFTVEIAEDAPRWVIGDRTRLRQVLGHFVTFFVDVVGTKDVRLTVNRADGGLALALHTAVQGGDRPGWQPEAMFDRGSAQYGDFASDSLGPMIARGLVSLMGGTVSLERPEAGRATLSVVLPLELVEGASDTVRIESETVTLQILLKALLGKLGLNVWDLAGAEYSKVAAVLIEAGGDEEALRVARLRSDHPVARLVAVGTPRGPELFDVVCHQPVTPDSLAEALRVGPIAEVGIS